MNIRPIFWLLPALFAAQVQAAPLPPKVEQSLTAPEEHFDKQPPADVPTPPEPPQQSESSSLTISSEELQKQPALLKQAFYSAIAANNTPAVRLLLPLYRRLPDGNEEVPIALSEAMIARADGHYAQAIEKFRFALDKQPDMPVAQMSLAQTLHSDYRYPSAAKAFEEIAQRTDLPPEFHQVAQTYLNSIKAREDWKFQVNGNYLDDKNVSNTPDRYIIGAWSLNPPESAHGISYYGSVSREKWLADHFTLRYGADLYGKTYWDNHRFDDLAVRVKAGFGYQTGRSETVVQPYFERRWFGSDGYSRELGIGIDWSYWLTPRNQLMLSAAHATQNYDDRRYLEGRLRTASATWLFVSSGTQYWTLGTDWTRKTAQDASDAYRRQAVRVGWTQQWPAQFGTSVNLSWAKRTYDRPNFPFNYIRIDHERSAAVSLWNRKVQWWGIIPRLVWRWQQTRSNHPFYGDYTKRDVFIQLNKAF